MLKLYIYWTFIKRFKFPPLIKRIRTEYRGWFDVQIFYWYNGILFVCPKIQSAELKDKKDIAEKFYKGYYERVKRFSN